MSISKEELIAQSGPLGFRPEIFEKVWMLMEVLNEINAHPYLKERLVLKGGTALNLFVFDLPRLSVDIDLNYIGRVDRDGMLEERSEIEDTFKRVCESKGLSLVHTPNFHSGGKFELKFDSALGHRGNLEIDLNYMYRKPLWEPKRMKSIELGSQIVNQALVLTAEELGAGKLNALFSRTVSRDLYDTYFMLNHADINKQKLKLAFIAYGVMGGLDLRTLDVKQVQFNQDDFEKKLVPVIQQKYSSNRRELISWGKEIAKKCRESLKPILSFSKNEEIFLSNFYDKGSVEMELITDDVKLIENFSQHPLLSWRIQQMNSK